MYTPTDIEKAIHYAAKRKERSQPKTQKPSLRNATGTSRAIQNETTSSYGEQGHANGGQSDADVDFSFDHAIADDQSWRETSFAEADMAYTYGTSAEDDYSPYPPNMTDSQMTIRQYEYQTSGLEDGNGYGHEHFGVSWLSHSIN